MNEIERQIIDKLVDDILTAGYRISVFDGVEYPIKLSTDKAAIMAEIGATDFTGLIVRDDGVRQVGWIELVHGNGCDVISDHNVGIEHLVAGATELAEKFQ